MSILTRYPARTHPPITALSIKTNKERRKAKQVTPWEIRITLCSTRVSRGWKIRTIISHCPRTCRQRLRLKWFCLQITDLMLLRLSLREMTPAEFKLLQISSLRCRVLTIKLLYLNNGEALMGPKTERPPKVPKLSCKRAKPSHPLNFCKCQSRAGNARAILTVMSPEGPKIAKLTIS